MSSHSSIAKAIQLKIDGNTVNDPPVKKLLDNPVLLGSFFEHTRLVIKSAGKDPFVY